jgi:mono/diheme cytochrome c family protein
MRRAAFVAVALLAAGCGSGAHGSEPTTTGPNAPPGEALFVQSCGSCHKLDAAGTTGSFGRDLDELKPSSAAVLMAIHEGPGTMPEDILTGNDAQVVADYVARVAGT